MKAFKLRTAVTMVIPVSLIVTSLVLPGSALAQTANTGVITGVVKDPSGVVAGATVKAINKGTGVTLSTTTGDSGSY